MNCLIILLTMHTMISSLALHRADTHPYSHCITLGPIFTHDRFCKIADKCLKLEAKIVLVNARDNHTM